MKKWTGQGSGTERERERERERVYSIGPSSIPNWVRKIPIKFVQTLKVNIPLTYDSELAI